MSHYEFVRFDEEYADDFRGLILPDVMEQLRHCGDFEENLILCAGVVDGDMPVAAAVVQLLQDKEVYLYSLYVAPEHRRKHLATEMMDRIEAEAMDAYSVHNIFADGQQGLYIHTEYALPLEDAQGLTAFLRAYGFREFIEKKPCYLFSSDELKASTILANAFTPEFRPDASVTNLSALLGDKVLAAAEYLDFFSLDSDPDLFFTLRDGETVLASMAAIYGAENEVSVFFSQEQEIGQEAYLVLLKALLCTLGENYPEFTLVASTDRCGESPLWETIAAECGKIFFRTEAGKYVIFK